MSRQIFDEETMTAIAAAPTAGHAVGMFWAEALKKPRYDNGDDSNSGAMLQLLCMQLRSTQPEPTDEQWAQFVENVAAFVNARLSSVRHVETCVDYDPDYALAAAAEDAGIKMAGKSWPCKTHADVGGDRVVEVRFGYTADWVEVWTPPPLM
jgi:hypothetical protein